MMMLGALPIAAFVLVALDLVRRAAERGEGAAWRHAVLSAALTWATALVLITEALSLFGALSRTWVAAAWGAAVAASVAVFLRSSRLCRVRAPALPPDRALLAMLCGVGAIALLTGLTAVAAPPNTWDSLTYHMGRTIHWIQNGSVAHYPTHITRQLYLNPGAECILTHVVILSGSDRWANLLQWAAMLGCLAGTSLLVRELGGSVRAQILAVVFTATLPVGILQSSSTQNDYVVSFWLVSLAYWVLRARRAGSGLRGAAMVGLSLGLALLTKGTAYAYALPFVAWFAIQQARLRRRGAWGPLLAAAGLCVLLNAGHWTRNVGVFGLPVGRTTLYANTRMGLRLFASNVVRSLALHTALPWSAWNRLVEGAVGKFHDALGVSKDYAKTTFPGARFRVPGRGEQEASRPTFSLGQLLRHEDYAGNPAHLVLVILAAGGCLGAGRFRRDRTRWLYLLAAGAAVALFCAFYRWQPWQARLHLGAFVLWAPLMGWALDRLPTRGLAAAVGVCLLALSAPWVVGNTTRPLISPNSVLWRPRNEEYLATKREFWGPFHAAARLVAARGWTNIGLVLEENSGEYALWALLRQELGREVRVEHVAVRNESRRLTGGRPFFPEAVLAETPVADPIPDRSFECLWREGPLRLFVPKEQTAKGWRQAAWKR